MSHNLFLREQCIAERVQNMQAELQQAQMLATMTERHSVGKHILGRLGTHLVTLGTWLERIDHSDRSLATSK